MKKISLIITSVAFILAMASCEKVKEPFTNEIEFSSDKVVLLEDYTGVKCVNCPSAAEIAHNLQKQFPDNLIVIGVHAGALATPDFITPAGSDWWNTFGFQANPIGTINRHKSSNGYGFSKEAWAAEVSSIITSEDPLDVKVKIQPIVYDTASRTIEVKVKSTFQTEIEGDFYLFACIIEDSIVGKQQTPSGIVNDYIHRHVLRKAINGSWGEQIFNGITETDFEITTELTATLDDKFNDKQCYVVAYVYDNNDYHILQAAQRKIVVK